MVDIENGCKQNIRPLKLGGVPEWPKGSDCKSDGSTFGGSNPPPSTIFRRLKVAKLVECK